MPDRWVNPPQAPWGSPPPRRPSTNDPWWRRWYVIFAAALVLLGIVALAALVFLVALIDGNGAGNTASRSTAPPSTSYTPADRGHDLADHIHGSTDDHSNGQGPKPGRYEPSAGEGHPRRPRPQRDGQVQIHRSLSCGHGDLSVTQDGNSCRSRQQDHRGGRQGAAIAANDGTAATAYFSAAELRSVLPRHLPHLPQSERRGLRLRGRVREWTAVRRGSHLSKTSRPIWLGCRWRRRRLRRGLNPAHPVSWPAIRRFLACYSTSGACSHPGTLRLVRSGGVIVWMGNCDRAEAGSRWSRRPSVAVL
jgi:hypothetical protein